MSMRVGAFVSECWGPASSIDEVRHRARRAEALGFASAWVPYLPWSLDALACVQAAGEATERIALGTAVVPTYFFHPLALARQAATVQAAVGRPVELGIGCSNPAVVAMHGLPFDRPARHVRETVEVLRAALTVGAKPTGEREGAGLVQYEGEIFRIGSVYGTPGAREAGSILVGALGPRMLAAAGSCADGTIATWSDEGAIEREIAPPVRDAAHQAGRPPPRVAGVVATAIVPRSRAEAARDLAQEQFGFYEAHMPYRRVVQASDAERIADIAVIGDEEEVARRLRRFSEAGMTDFLAAPLAVEGSDWEQTASRLLALAP